MCSISGFYDPTADFTGQRDSFLHILDEMKHCLAHRGPDDNDSLLTPHCGLAHTRLSIIDLAGGHQPMTRELDGYPYHIVYNGEIYNMKELKNDLANHQVFPKTNSDTEILLLSYLTFGADFVKKVDGIFAFAIYDERHNTMTLFRDSFGVKPLFYTMINGTIVFSSEPKGCFCFPGVKAELDVDGLNEILSLGPARTPGSGVFYGFHELLPGCYLTCSVFGRKMTQYFHLESRPHFDSYEETVEKTSFLIQDAIKRQMVSDVPICTFLSGGVDSSVVSAVCAAELKKQGKKLTTFSFDFIDNDKYFKANSFQPSQDRPYVDKMVSFLDSDHHYLECDNKMQADLLYRSVIDNSRIIINLASKEYSKCIEKYLTRQDRYITITFCELSGDKLVTKGTYAKMARGEMVRFMAENRIENPEDIKKFDRLGYSFRSDLSSDAEYVFERKK